MKARRQRIENTDIGDLFTAPLKLARHLEGHRRPAAVTGDEIRTLGLVLADILQMIDRHRLDAIMHLVTQNTAGLQSNHRPLLAQDLGKFAQVIDVAANTARDKERRFGVRIRPLCHHHGGIPRRILGRAFMPACDTAHRAFSFDLCCQTADGRMGKQGRDRQFQIEMLFDLIEQFDRQHRMPAQLEEIVINADIAGLEDFGPDFMQPLLDRAARIRADRPVGQNLLRQVHRHQFLAIYLLVGRQR